MSWLSTSDCDGVSVSLMRRVGVTLLALAALGCEDEGKPAKVELHPKATTSPPIEHVVEREKPAADWPPPIPGLLLDKLAVEREGSFALPDGADQLTPRAAVAIGDGFALVGDARVGHRQRWLGFAPGDGSARELSFDAGSITAAISDGDGGALLAGHAGLDGDARAWFGALDGRAKLTASVELDGDAPVDVVDVLAGHEPDERALLLGNVSSRGWALSFDERDRVRWKTDPGELGSTLVHAGVWVPAAGGELLVIGTRPEGAGEAAWSRRDDGRFEQGEFAIEGADPIRTLDAIVALDHDMGFIALGRAKRETTQDHDQVIAVGFDRRGQPTWARVLEHFRASEIYGGTIHRGQPGVAHFLARIPVGGEPSTALGWIEICPGVDGVVVARQIAGTLGWESTGFVDGRDDGAMLTYMRTAAGIDWRVLLVRTDHLWG